MYSADASTVRSVYSFTHSITIHLLYDSSDSVTSGPELQTEAPKVTPAILTSTTVLLSTMSASPSPTLDQSQPVEEVEEVPPGTYIYILGI